TALHFAHGRPRVDGSARLLQASREGIQIFHRIKLRLLRKLQTRTDIRTLWRIRQKADIAEAGPARCRQLIVERAQRIPRGAKEITVDARKIAIDILLEHGSFNEIDRRCMALRSEARTVEPMQAL